MVVLVTDWESIDNQDELSGREKHVVAEIINTGESDYVVWIPEWLVDDPDTDIESYETMYRIAVGEIQDYSEKAWKFWQPDRDGKEGYLPKSQVVVFERLGGREIHPPTKGLSTFSGGDA